MRNKTNTVLFSTLSAIGIGTFIFCVIGIVFDVVCKGHFQMENYSYTKMAVGALVVGLGFGLPAFVYDNEKISVCVKTLIHMGTGCIVMTVTAFAVGWIPTEKGSLAVVGVIAGEIAVAFTIWIFFYTHQKKLAKEINKRIAEKDISFLNGRNKNN